ncbi:MAG: hypothetical protein A3J24_11400 [Deltaproteobacteria bacterium RIFCSPLOWO2_02_FULL_53_8]|nr:MAG: hypothetical protein A3J24_11400 [Deltaproteobacteria bacterium RIFCSPLOWO2_02_FULL_53_8]
MLELVIAERANGKHAEYFKNYRDTWRSRFVEYIDHNGDPALIATSAVPDEERARFINLYEAKNGSQVPVIKALRKNNLMCCPACGEEGNPETLDHYLPKSLFPEYSVHTKNLVPMCGLCQRIKDSSVCNEDGLRQYLHAYYDTILVPLYNVTIKPPYSAPSAFLVSVLPNVPEPLRALAFRHIKALEIDMRFQVFCEEKYLHILKLATLQRTSEGSLSGVLRNILPLEEMKAINSWVAVFYRSVLADASLIDYLETFDLPSNM